MRRLIVALLVVASGCLDTPPSAPAVAEPFKDPPVVPDVEPSPAPTTTSVPPTFDPKQDLRVQAEGFRSSALSFGAEFTIQNLTFAPGDGEEPAVLWVALLPTDPPTTSCEKPSTTFRYQWLGTPLGNLVGEPIPAGNYALLSFSAKAHTLDFDLGERGVSTPRELSTEVPSFGLRIVHAAPHQKVVSLATRVTFDTSFTINGTALFFSQFTVRANAFQGSQHISNSVFAGEEGCGATLLQRSGSEPSGAWTAPLNRTLAAGTFRWLGDFEARAAANPRGSAYGYLIEWPRASNGTAAP